MGRRFGALFYVYFMQKKAQLKASWAEKIGCLWGDTS